MKKYIGISIIAIVIAALAFAFVIVNDSRDYFKEYFETKRVKLDLRQESSVDSLLQVITVKTIMVDSLTSALTNEKTSHETVVKTLQNNIASLEKSVKNLNNVITHQNQMIDELRKNQK